MSGRFCVYVPCLLLLICLLSGCSTESASLSEEQEAKVNIICQNVDIWGESCYESFRDWPMNRIYVAETEDGMTVFTVGYRSVPDYGALENHTPVSTFFYLGVHAYAVMEDSNTIKAYPADVGNWSDCGIGIDLETMSGEELREAIRQSYLDFLNRRSQETIEQSFTELINKIFHN